MRSAQVLAAVARRLNRDAGAPAIPSLYLFTDPNRLPDAEAAALRLPRGAAVVYRHFGDSDRRARAGRLAGICRRRGLILLISADPELAAAVGAAGVHWPERLASARVAHSGLTTISAHSAEAVGRAFALGADACVLAPIFASGSASAVRPLGLFRAAQIAKGARGPVIALGGISPDNADRLTSRGFAGIAAVEALSGV